MEKILDGLAVSIVLLVLIAICGLVISMAIKQPLIMIIPVASFLIVWAVGRVMKESKNVQ